jgi:delta 1-pyrroline-5-carboxylate dehydrogenase
MPDRPAADEISATVSAQVREIVAAAERAAAQLEQEVETEATRRASEILLGAEEDAQAYLAESRRRVDAFAQSRVARIQELCDDLIVRAEAISTRLTEAEELQGSLRDLVSALNNAARATTAEASRPGVRLPGVREDADLPGPRRTGPTIAEASSSSEAEGHVREVARDLPRPPRRARTAGASPIRPVPDPPEESA